MIAQTKLKKNLFINPDGSNKNEVMQTLADLIEGSIFKVMLGSGHIPCVDNPTALSKLIIDFIKK